MRKIQDEPTTVDEKITKLEFMCRVAFDQAMAGDKDARNWIADRTEGKALERIEQKIDLDEIVIK